MRAVAPGNIAAAAQEEAATQEVPRSWTLFSQLELHSDAEKLRLASFLDRVQRQTAAESSTSLGQNTEEHEQQRRDEVVHALYARKRASVSEGDGHDTTQRTCT